MKFTRAEVEEIKANLPNSGLVETARARLQDGKLHMFEKEVVPIEDAPLIIAEHLRNPATTGGRDRLFDRIKRQYLGISRRMISKFLNNDFTQQVHRPLNARLTSRPIVTNGPAKMAQIDLVDMQKLAGVNNNDRYFLVFVDLFSKWMAARRLKNKTTLVVQEALNDILTSMPPDWRPKTIQSDNGSEFQEGMRKMLERKWDIKLIHSQSYNPSAQGAVERLNREIKSLIFKNMHYWGESKKWNDLLEQLVKNHNTSKHSSTGWVPLEMMNTDLTPAQIAEIQEHIRGRLKTPIDTQEFNIGDQVRVALPALKTEERKLAKFRKQIKQNWSSEVFQIVQKSEPDQVGAQPQYLLKNLETNRTWSKRFWSYQLMKIDGSQVRFSNLAKSDRPDFDPNVFNQEKHLARLHEERKESKAPEPAPLPAREPRKRAWKPTERLLQNFRT